MRIIIEGDRKIQERKHTAVKRFNCGTCGCVFDANSSEYERWGADNMNNVAIPERYTFIFCACPCCGNKVWRRMADA